MFHSSASVFFVAISAPFHAVHFEWAAWQTKKNDRSEEQVLRREDNEQRTRIASLHNTQPFGNTNKSCKNCKRRNIAANKTQIKTDKKMHAKEKNEQMKQLWKIFQVTINLQPMWLEMTLIAYFAHYFYAIVVRVLFVPSSNRFRSTVHFANFMSHSMVN